MPEREPLVNESVRYEPDNARVGAILESGVGLVVGVVAFAGAALIAYTAFMHAEDRAHRPLSAIEAQEQRTLPHDLAELPVPVLQTDEPVDLERFRRSEDARLGNYGWVDPKSQRVHIP